MVEQGQTGLERVKIVTFRTQDPLGVRGRLVPSTSGMTESFKSYGTTNEDFALLLSGQVHTLEDVLVWLRRKFGRERL